MSALRQRVRIPVATIAALVLLTTLGTRAHAWKSLAKWPARVVGYQVNPKNQDVSDAAALKAVRWSADAWTKQSGAAFRFRFDGSTSSTTIGLDNKNMVIFRDAAGSSDTVRASTYTYRLLGTILDTDIVFWDKTMSFTTKDASTPCKDQIIIEHTAIHELGHALGLEHATDDKATMWGKAPACSTYRLTLHADDIAGVETLYPCSKDSHCDDANPCTTDVCKSGRCERTPKCDDGNPCTKDTCSGGTCKHAAIAGCCTKSSQCDDGDACTKDSCESNKCKHAAIADCCTKASQCDDGDACTKDTCNASHACVFTALDCCPGPCDAGGPTPGDPDGGAGTPPTPDPGTPTPDPGTPIPDPGTPTPDPGTPTPDPGTPAPETPANDEVTGAGCALAAPGGEGDGAPALGLLLLLLARRRRRAPDPDSHVEVTVGD